MSKYRVLLEMRVQTSVEVEAESEDAARRIAEKRDLPSLNSSNGGMDEANEWESYSAEKIW